MREITITRVVMVARTSRSCRPLRFMQISWSWLSHDLPQPYARHWQGDLPISPTPTVRVFANEPRVSSSGNVYFEPTLLGLHALSRAASHSRASAGLGSFPALRCRWFFWPQSPQSLSPVLHSGKTRSYLGSLFQPRETALPSRPTLT